VLTVGLAPVEAIVVRDGKITFVGSKVDALKQKAEGTVVPCGPKAVGEGKRLPTATLVPAMVLLPETVSTL
jgi:hypothetical protein